MYSLCVCVWGGGPEFWNTRCLVLWQIGHLSWVHWLVFFYLDAYWSGEISLDSLEWLTRVRVHPGKQRFSSVLTQRSLFCKKVNCYGPVFTRTHTFHGFVLQMYQTAVHTWSPCTYLCTAVSLYCVHILAVFLCVCVCVCPWHLSPLLFSTPKSDSRPLGGYGPSTPPLIGALLLTAAPQGGVQLKDPPRPISYSRRCYHSDIPWKNKRWSKNSSGFQVVVAVGIYLWCC